MKVSGFSFIKNAIKFGFPIVEAIESILPICDNFYIAVGKSDDETLELIKSIKSDKIKIIETVWDEELIKGGKVLAAETDKAFNSISDDSDWAFYIQGDEVVHEKYLSNIKKAMEKYKNDEKVDGLLFNYHHFYGSYDYIGDAARWYPHEIRVIKNKKNIYSYDDAQGFRKNDNEKLNVKLIDAYMYHYGWVKEPKTQNKKREGFRKLYSIPNPEGFKESNDFDYSKIDALHLFKGTHPKVMQKLIAKKNWSFDYDISINNLSFKHKMKKLLKKLTGIQLGYKNYKIV